MTRKVYVRSMAQKVLTKLANAAGLTVEFSDIMADLKEQVQHDSSRSRLYQTWLKRGWIIETRTVTLTTKGLEALNADQSQEKISDPKRSGS